MKFQRYKSYKQYRLINYDYSKPGKYFVTIVTKNREEYFGKIDKGEIILSNIGKIVEKFWITIPYKFINVSLDVFQIMPDHLHGIIEINKIGYRNVKNKDCDKSNQEFDKSNSYINENIKSGIINNPMELKQITLGYILRWFKAEVKNYASKNRISFNWQPRFRDRIIRNNDELNLIRAYIKNNILNYTNKNY